MGMRSWCCGRLASITRVATVSDLLHSNNAQTRLITDVEAYNSKISSGLPTCHCHPFQQGGWECILSALFGQGFCCIIQAPLAAAQQLPPPRSQLRPATHVWSYLNAGAAVLVMSKVRAHSLEAAQGRMIAILL